MMYQVRQGSIMLFMLLLVAAITITTINLMQSTTFAVGIVHKRQLFMQRLWATEGLLRYGIAVCKANYEQLMAHATQSEQETTMLFEQWPCGDRKWYTAKLTIRVDVREHMLHLHAQLQEGKGACVCAMRAEVRTGPTAQQSHAAHDWIVQSMTLV